VLALGTPELVAMQHLSPAVLLVKEDVVVVY
jgi:hypothetical protein